MEIMSLPMFAWMLMNAVAVTGCVFLLLFDKSWWTSKQVRESLEFIIGTIISVTLWGIVWILSY